MGSKTTSQVTNAANPDAQAAYSNVVGQAESVASTPYSPYGGQLVAGLNTGQNASIGELRGAYGAAQPYVDQGASYLGQGAQGLGAVGSYLQAGSDAAAGAASYQGLGAASFGQAGSYAGQSASALAGMQPYMGAAASDVSNAENSYAAASSLGTPQQFSAGAVEQYENPYTQSVIGSTMANLNENDAQQSEQLASSAIGSGAYGGDRSGVAQAELARQQDLANNQTVAGLESQNYTQALGQFNTTNATNLQAAGVQSTIGQGYLASASGYDALAQEQGQQAQEYGTLAGVANSTGSGYTGLAADSLGQASAYGTLGQLQGTTGQAYGTLAGLAGNLGTTAQGDLVSGASAGLQGATLQQQNQQQQDTAAYNQYMAGLSYPYQNVGFLSNIVQGIGSQEGNTQTTQGNALSSIAGLGTSTIGILGATGGFGANGYLSGLGSTISSAFSDARVKDDIASIGTTHDGQPIYRFRYKGDPKVQMGLMAQDVEKRDPGAVGEFGGIKTVDYDRATAGAAALGLGARPGDPRPQRAMGGPVGLGMSPMGGPTMPMQTPVGLGARPRFDAGGTVDTGAPIPSGGISFGGVPGSGAAGLGAGGLNTSASGLTGGMSGLGAGRPIQAQPQGQGASQPAGLGVMSGAPQASGGLSAAPSGGFEGSQNGSSGGLSQNAWMGILSAGLGMMGGTSMSGLANIGQGAQQGLQTYLGLQQRDVQNSQKQQELALDRQRADSQAAFQSGSLALEKQKEDFTERRTQMMMDAAQRASDMLAGATAPAAAAAQQPPSAPSGGSAGVPAPLQSGASAVPPPVASGATPNGAPAAGGWMSNTIPGSAAPVPTAPATASASPPPALGATQGAAMPAAGSDFWSKVSPDSNPLLLTQQAQRYAAAGKAVMATNPEAANQLFGQSTALQGRARQIYDTGKVMMADGSLGTLPGANAAAAAATTATEQAKAGVADQHDLVKVADPNGGGEQYVPKSIVMQAAQGGALPSSGPPGAGSAPGSTAAAVASASPMLASNPAFIAQAQSDKAKQEAEMDQQFQARQISRQRIGDLRDIMTKYQTGDLAGAKADAVAFGRAIGMPVDDTATASPEFFQRFGKDATANVFNDVKGMGGRVLVSEIDGLTKANANAGASPGANAAILNQGLGVLNYEDQHYKDYMAWRDQNPNAWNASKFEIGWQGQNNPQTYVDQAGKDFAYKGQSIPAPAQRTAGQMYMTPAGPRRWMGQGWAAN